MLKDRARPLAKCEAERRAIRMRLPLTHGAERLTHTHITGPNYAGHSGPLLSHTNLIRALQIPEPPPTHAILKVLRNWATQL